MEIRIFTNISPHYRKSLWVKLLDQTVYETHFFYGSNKKLGNQPIDFTAKEFSPYKNQLHQLKNFWFNDKILIGQTGVIKQCSRKI